VLSYHLSRHFSELTYYVISEQSLLDELCGHDLHILGEFSDKNPKEVIQPESVDAVVVDRTLDYRKLNRAY